MIKKIMGIGAFSLLLLNGYAQKDNNKNLLSLSFGPSIPVGDYANTSLTNENAGFAKTGQTINISFEHKLGKHFGIAAMLYGQKNVLNTNAIAQQFAQTAFISNSGYAGNYTPGQPQPTPTYTYVYYPNWTVDNNSYYLGSFLVGGAEEFSVGKSNNLSFVTKAMIGIANATSPALNGKSGTDTSVIFVSQNKVSAFDFSYLINAGLKYKLTKKWNLLFTMDYVGTNKIKFENVTGTTRTVNGVTRTSSGDYLSGNSTIAIESETGVGIQTFQSINLNLGIGVSF